MIFTLSESIFLNLNTLSGSKITIVVLSGGKDLESVYPFGSIFAEKDTLLGSKNGEHDSPRGFLSNAKSQEPIKWVASSHMINRTRNIPHIAGIFLKLKAVP